MQISNKEISIDGSEKKIVIILPYFNENFGLELFENTKKELLVNKVKEENITLIRVGGALETPFASKKIIIDQKPDGIIALGIVIRGETSHYDLVTENTYNGLMQVQLEMNTPIVFGILSCENIPQAKARIGENGLNKGKEFAQSILIQTII